MCRLVYATRLPNTSPAIAAEWHRKPARLARATVWSCRAVCHQCCRRRRHYCPHRSVRRLLLLLAAANPGGQRKAAAGYHWDHHYRACYLRQSAVGWKRLAREIELVSFLHDDVRFEARQGKKRISGAAQWPLDARVMIFARHKRRRRERGARSRRRPTKATPNPAEEDEEMECCESSEKKGAA